jgi:hypothetical protein
MALPDETDPARLIVAAAGVHLAISIGWAIVLDRLLPRRATIVAGGAAGVAIAAFDLGVVGPRFPRVAALPRGPQVADHVAFGAIAGALIARRRARR